MRGLEETGTNLDHHQEVLTSQNDHDIQVEGSRVNGALRDNSWVSFSTEVPTLNSVETSSIKTDHNEIYVQGNGNIDSGNATNNVSVDEHSGEIILPSCNKEIIEGNVQLSQQAVVVENLVSVVVHRKELNLAPIKNKRPASTPVSGSSLQCDHCYKQFLSSRHFHRHHKAQSLKYHACLKCHIAFPYKAYLLAHTKYHDIKDNLDNYCCDQCQFSSKDIAELKRHMLIHTKECTLKCCRCTRTFSQQSELNDHLEKHRHPGMVRCSCCNQRFKTRAEMAEHKLALRVIKCEFCEEVFSTLICKDAHLRLVHQDKILKCKLCARVYTCEDSLRRHTNYHRVSKRKQCPVCGGKYLNLPKHILTHTRVEDMLEASIFKCDKCPAKFKMRLRLRKHIQNCHGERKFKCHLCPFISKTREILQRHFINVHSGRLPKYQCEICGKQCKTASNLRIHKRIHSDTKEFQCHLCSQGFNYKASLQSHLKSKHETG